MNSKPFLDRLDSGVFETEHWLRSWIQRRIFGYRIVRVTMEPATSWLGGIHYRTHWFLAR